MMMRSRGEPSSGFLKRRQEKSRSRQFLDKKEGKLFFFQVNPTETVRLCDFSPSLVFVLKTKQRVIAKKNGKF